MASGSITSWQIDGETMETDLIFLGSKITADGDCSHEIKRHLLLGRKAINNLRKWESEVAQSCPTLCDPMDCSLPGSSVHGIFQARVLEWIVISFSRISSRPRDWTWVSCTAGRHFIIWTTREALLLLSSFSRVQLCATPETAAHQAPPSLGFSRQEQWSRLPFPSPMHESEKWKWSRSVVSDS